MPPTLFSTQPQNHRKLLCIKERMGGAHRHGITVLRKCSLAPNVEAISSFHQTRINFSAYSDIVDQQLCWAVRDRIYTC